MSELKDRVVLLPGRVILLEGAINDFQEAELSRLILNLNLEDESAIIELRINSRGGLIPAQSHMVDAILYSDAPVHGTVTRRAYSSALTILQACVWRRAYRNACLMFHGPNLTGVRIDDPKFKAILKETRGDHAAFLEDLSKRTGQSVKKLARWSSEEKYFNAKKALRYGLIDEIVPVVARSEG